ncbi:hypothetical protein V1512DRAFT_262083 [Lipomyces arxii]|uniref:uncharacterized protein n=1 Tax=Lipomyces arxii TaxID=56418 RepID=UPI0034CD99F4
MSTTSVPSSGDQSPARPPQSGLPYIVNWDIDEVGNWLDQIGLRQYKESFAENDITGEVLIYLDHDFLKELEVSSVGHRLHMLKSIYNIKIEQDIPIEQGQFVPLSIVEQDAADREQLSMHHLVQALELRDRRILHNEQEIKRLMDNYSRLREDLMPIFKMVKETKPLPTPQFPQQSYSTPSFSRDSNLGTAGSRHSMFISSSQSLTDPQTYPHPYPSLSSGLHQNNLTRKASSKKIGKIGNSPTHTPEWLDSVLIPQSSTAPLTSTTSLSSSAPIGSDSNPVSAPGSANGTPPAIKDHHYRNPISAASTPVLSPPTTTTPNPMPISSSVPSSFSPSLTLSEAFKRFKLKQDDPCYKVLPAVLKGHKINDDWRQYALLVCFGDQERIIGLDEKPLSVLKELQDAGKQPVFMLRPIQGMKHEQGALVSGTPGGVL